MMRSDSKARILLEEYWNMHIPVDITYIVSKMGWVVNYADLQFKNFNIDVNKRTITINSELSDTTKRSALATALGCVIYNYYNEDVYQKLNNYSSQIETQIGLFVRTLLMPAEAIKVIVDIRNNKDPVQIRKLFDVSSSMLHTRLQELGYFG